MGEIGVNTSPQVFSLFEVREVEMYFFSPMLQAGVCRHVVHRRTVACKVSFSTGRKKAEKAYKRLGVGEGPRGDRVVG